MFPLFRSHERLRRYQVEYCEGDFKSCERYKWAITAVMPKPRLLPDGEWLPVEDMPKAEAEAEAESDSPISRVHPNRKSA